MLKNLHVLVSLFILMPWLLLLRVWYYGPVDLQIRQKGYIRDGEYQKQPIIYAITPTYSRAVQKAELTRLANTFLNVVNLHWIVVEDSQSRTPLVSRLLQTTGLPYTHLNVPSPTTFKTNGKGTLQRNKALEWLRETFKVDDTHLGVVYFADDDNTYSLQLFDEMRWTTKVSVWPVAFAGGVRYESPKVNSMGKVDGWNVSYDPNRPFAIDMAGFAVNLHLILSKPSANFELLAKGGRQESSLLTQLVSLDDLEPKAQNCTKVLVWHTRTQKPNLALKDGKGFTDPNIET
ncbi:galactosylgalactosylxylosylprotein 3-beta-glucuronosyltransferase 1 [Entelurus aequoreus]|uniref:galactosylgalactosylxylosylprotein 3-beta-glucuronosyltransferase 1 n=1 Tax=Entelurus aequoreus TaxID=161455 RepID=UPI002B1DD751|nr:galactosylgalactosylxylosylprotein 3-beta-glucuronosyltransferase 1 [Entelurus aequoreus]XP_061904355.1 galactosylgalactosylxylosylprotein 3-beta-glucuronosyltransferase 1 [Entelurus aequoreus]XP_061904356.1 galactosylgalactosylxylosylprotein 3-beta-glucuronosyltransferase 1 [Entelurus aequoreus]XP_061904357.1 galactosylgalactosylxylosylprotein 3-beta-glucuronosyltransferase 1 [Entelurus aequoreus]XP_061904358.1 galactosylgalactosylxylosylprotein 3-beta-glucuronosyltransferase 1 [Entelurus a